MIQTAPTHARRADVITNAHLNINGIEIGRLAQRVGQTPFYAYDRQALTQRAAWLRESLPAGVDLHYAVKANPMPALVCHMVSLVDGLDVASGGELRLALNSGMPAARISFAGPGKSEAELRQAIAAGVLINVESGTELARIATQAETLGIKARIALRINPDFELKSAGMKMSGGPKPFGIDAECIPEVLQGMSNAALGFEGFHLFAGSQNLKADAIVLAQQQSFELAMRLARYAPSALRTLNLGGGFGIPYFPGEQHLDLAAIGENLAELDARLQQAHPGARLNIELGRFLVAEAGFYVCRVVDIKQSRGETFAITDGGLHHHLAASGNFGQVIRKNYPILVGNKAGQTPSTRYTVVGPLCTPLDVLGKDVDLPELAIDDLIVITQSGAYGASASPQAFLSHTPVIEVLV